MLDKTFVPNTKSLTNFPHFGGFRERRPAESGQRGFARRAVADAGPEERRFVFEQLAEKSVEGEETVPPRLKPDRFCDLHLTAEAVPLQNGEFSASSAVGALQGAAWAADTRVEEPHCGHPWRLHEKIRQTIVIAKHTSASLSLAFARLRWLPGRSHGGRVIHPLATLVVLVLVFALLYLAVRRKPG
jgi:hypothetical protein